ncbi:MAG: DUF5397 domain-containing protein [Acidobacteriota bacterium]|nr:DUF5397 domain-containing protein [Acidobacteriota bacterium]
MAATLAQPAAIPVGVIKQFGPFGPEYEVLGPTEPEEAQRRVKIVLIRTGEETTYGFDAMMEDPEAR